MPQFDFSIYFSICYILFIFISFYPVFLYYVYYFFLFFFIFDNVLVLLRAKYEFFILELEDKSHLKFIKTYKISMFDNTNLNLFF
jgi:hypothetical protein